MNLRWLKLTICCVCHRKLYSVLKNWTDSCTVIEALLTQKKTHHYQLCFLKLKYTSAFICTKPNTQHMRLGVNSWGTTWWWTFDRTAFPAMHKRNKRQEEPFIQVFRIVISYFILGINFRTTSDMNSIIKNILNTFSADFNQFMCQH